MKKILFVVDERKMGGVSVLLSDILNTINIKKYNIDLMILHDNGEELSNLPKNIEIIYGTKFFDVVDLSLKEVIKTKKLKTIIKKLYLIFLLKTGLIKNKIKKERKKCITKNYDIEIAFKDGFTALFTAYGNSKKKYHWLHTDYSMWDCTANYKKLFKKTFEQFNKIIGISYSVVKKFQEKYPNTKCEVIYNLINIDKIKTKAMEKNIEYEEELNLVSVGRIHNMKGYDRLIKVFNKLNKDKKLNNVKLRIIGNGPDLPLVKNLIKEYNLEDKVILLGEKKNPYPYVIKSDAFIMCSRYEPFGIVILEALILQVPVISTKIASIDEIMKNEYGIITENSEEGLYDSILQIIDNKKQLLTYKKNLSKYKYDTNKIIKQIENLLNEV